MFVKLLSFDWFCQNYPMNVYQNLPIIFLDRFHPDSAKVGNVGSDRSDEDTVVVTLKKICFVKNAAIAEFF